MIFKYGTTFVVWNGHRLQMSCTPPSMWLSVVFQQCECAGERGWVLI